MKKLIVSIVVLTLLSTGSAMNSSSSEALADAETKSAQQSQIIQDKIFKLSDQTLNDAIALAKDDDTVLQSFERSRYLPSATDKMNHDQPEVKLITPYLLIVRKAYMKFENDEDFSLTDAKKVVHDYENLLLLSFEVTAKGDEIDFARKVDISLKQGSTVLHPYVIINKDNDAVESENWPNSPAYINRLFVPFDIFEINYAQDAELIYQYGSKKDTVRYKVDFSKIK
ncbi:hypothetical protein A8L34_15775 [Bacillus sp. FJAT-27264]|uniref:hypothetical protein n=1 Tax=Paenibacillus sp. (strain DSM 101736 / FJAT-27264) TaxID=1850362 RepID=UPI000807F8B4|nr:hypothetical protein [Bacillus sp. FJAT-27264]OBZ11791.1 hypothetical protein A8L34_15775 [Bacillus sp. FJAT-27264]